MKKYNIKNYPIYDYQQCLEAFVKSLTKLEEHIRAHKVHKTWKKDANQIKRAIKLYKQFLKIENYKNETENLDKFLDYVKANIRGWWC